MHAPTLAQPTTATVTLATLAAVLDGAKRGATSCRLKPCYSLPERATWANKPRGGTAHADRCQLSWNVDYLHFPDTTVLKLLRLLIVSSGGSVCTYAVFRQVMKVLGAAS